MENIKLFKCLDCSAICFEEDLGKITIPNQKEFFCKRCNSRNIVEEK